MKTAQVRKLLRPILSEAHPRLHDQITKGFYALRDWALANPFVKEVEVTQFVKVPEIVKEIHHVEFVDKLVEKLVADPDQSRKIDRLQKRVAKLEAAINTAGVKCEVSAGVALMRYAITKHGLTHAALDAWIDALCLVSLAECECIAGTTLSNLAYSSDAETKMVLGVSRAAFGKTVMAWSHSYFPEGLPQSDRILLKRILQQRRPDKKVPLPRFGDQSPQERQHHTNWLRCWLAIGTEPTPQVSSQHTWTPPLRSENAVALCSGSVVS